MTPITAEEVSAWFLPNRFGVQPPQYAAITVAISLNDLAAEFRVSGLRLRAERKPQREAKLDAVLDALRTFVDEQDAVLALRCDMPPPPSLEPLRAARDILQQWGFCLAGGPRRGMAGMPSDLHTLVNAIALELLIAWNVAGRRAVSIARGTPLARALQQAVQRTTGRSIQQSGLLKMLEPSRKGWATPVLCLMRDTVLPHIVTCYRSMQLMPHDPDRWRAAVLAARRRPGGRELPTEKA